MESRIEQTIEKRNKGYNCAQALACTYCDLVGMDEETMFRMTEGLGVGMGNMEGTCGAVSGACILAGMVKSTGNLDVPDSKAASGRLARQIIEHFEERNSTVTCKDLKGKETGKMLRSCPDCIRDAAEFVEKLVFEQNNMSDQTGNQSSGQ